MNASLGSYTDMLVLCKCLYYPLQQQPMLKNDFTQTPISDRPDQLVNRDITMSSLAMVHVHV